MELPQQLRSVWRYRWWLLAAGVVAAVVAFGISSQRPERYEGEALVRIIPSQATSGGFISQEALQQLGSAYVQLARSRDVGSAARRKADSTRPAAETRVSTEQGGIFHFIARDGNARFAARYANGQADAFVEAVADFNEKTREKTITKISDRVRQIRAELRGLARGDSERDVLLTEVQQLQAQSAQVRTRPVDTARVFERAEVSADPAFPRPERDAALAFLAVLFLGSLALYVRSAITDRYDSQEEIARDLGLPILGIVPKEQGHHEAVTEAFRAVRTNAAFAIADHTGTSVNGGPVRRQASTDREIGGRLQRGLAGWLRGQRRSDPHTQDSDLSESPVGQESAPVLLVTGAEEGSGKTYVTTNLAQAFAADGKQVAAIDADLRRPALHERLGVSPNPGLTDILDPRAQRRNGLPLQPVALPEGAHRRGGALVALAAGRTAADSSELLATSHMRSLIEKLTGDHALVMIDSPPVLAIADATILSQYADGVVLVVDAERTKRRNARRAVQALKGVDAKLIGVVFNRVSEAEAPYYGYGYGPKTPQPETERVGA